jgi:F-box and leucine-rich repeat protein 7
VTGAGVESVVDGCRHLRAFDVSQCKNLTPWFDSGGIYKYRNKVRFETVAKSAKYSR